MNPEQEARRSPAVFHPQADGLVLPKSRKVQRQEVPHPGVGLRGGGLVEAVVELPPGADVSRGGLGITLPPFLLRLRPEDAPHIHEDVGIPQGRLQAPVPKIIRVAIALRPVGDPLKGDSLRQEGQQRLPLRRLARYGAQLGNLLRGRRQGLRRALRRESGQVTGFRGELRRG